MTTLLFLLEPERVCLAMDTLCRLADGGQPLNFSTKMMPLPHLHGVICGTGVRELIYEWAYFVQCNAVAQDVTELDNIAQATLPKIAERYELDDARTCTIYHFGLWRSAGEFVGLAYRSTSGFSSEKLCHGLGIKPPDAIDLQSAFGTMEELGLPQGFVDIMRQQKVADDAKPATDRVGIGGEIQFLVMDADGIHLTTCHKFEDHAALFEDMMSRCTENPTTGG